VVPAWKGINNNKNPKQKKIYRYTIGKESFFAGKETKKGRTSLAVSGAVVVYRRKDKSAGKQGRGSLDALAHLL